MYCMTIPNGQDPDEYVNNYGRDSFVELSNNAKYWVEYLINKYEHDYDLNKPEQKKKYVDESLNIIRKLETESERDIYLNMVSKTSGIVKSILRSDLDNNSSDTNGEHDVAVVRNEEQIQLKENAYVKAVKFVLKALLEKKPYAELDGDIKQNLLNSDYLKIYEYIENCYSAGQRPLISALYTYFDIENNKDLSDLISFEILETDDNEKYYKDCVRNFVFIGLKQRQSDIIQKVRETKDQDERRRLTKELNEITLKLKR